MQPVILRIEETVEIAAPAAQVFALVRDPLAKAKLNPLIQVIRIEREEPGPLREGSVTFLRLQKGTQIFEHRTRCIRIEPDRLLEHKAELPTLFEVRVELEPILEGTRLTQREDCEITAAMLDALPMPRRAEQAWQAIKILGYIVPSLARETYAVILRERADALRVVLGRELRSWLQAIKRHLEAEEQGRSTVR